jgi:hypothetical protein
MVADSRNCVGVCGGGVDVVVVVDVVVGVAVGVVVVVVVDAVVAPLYVHVLAVLALGAS